MPEGGRLLRVLTIDGGGMRGLYTSTYLDALVKQAALRSKKGPLDVGRAFDLIVGTSTGGIIACALAAGVPLSTVSDLYRRSGKDIFPVKLTGDWRIVYRLLFGKKYLRAGTKALEEVLHDVLGDTTLEQVYDRRGIALAVTAVEMSRHRAWVFKTSHLGGHRDGSFRLVDVCLATSAAPIFRSMARIRSSMTKDGHHVFVDGGVWANNPVLVGMVDALQMTEPGDRIQIFCLGNCQRPPGDVIDANGVHRGLPAWKFGGEVAIVALDAQESVYDHMAGIIAEHVARDCSVVRFPRGLVSAKAMRYLDLDETSDTGMQALQEQAEADVSHTLSLLDHPSNQQAVLLASLLGDLPPVEQKEDSDRPELD